MQEAMQNVSNLAIKLENDLPEGFTLFTVVQSLNARRKLRRTNMVDCQNKEWKKQTRCIRVFLPPGIITQDCTGSSDRTG